MQHKSLKADSLGATLLKFIDSAPFKRIFMFLVQLLQCFGK